MKQCGWMPFASTLIVFLCTVQVAPAALVIEKVLPFATERELRVQVVLKSDKPGVIDVVGKIVPATPQSDAAFWEGSLGNPAASAGAPILVEQTIRELRPKLWSPGSPNLYNLVISAKQGSDSVQGQPLRFGFRSVTTKEGQILLNGKPIFLKGIAINPPGRDIPDDVGYSRQFAYEYVRYLRSQNVNLIRMTFDFKREDRQQVWFDACDELGMMVNQGCYGGPPGLGKKGPSFDPEEQQDLFAGKSPNAPQTSKSAPPTEFETSVKAYIDVFETYVRHPSVVIYILSNELPGPVGSKPEWHDYLTKVDARINMWDPTRIVIGNAGYGLGREGDINDIHRYWGWYYNSFLTYFNLRDTVTLFGASTDKQPFTFSECVGSFTSPLGPFNSIFRKQLAPQLGWTGHSGDQAKEALAYQSFMIKHAVESFRTMREQNHRIAGLMPFSIMFFNWEGIRSFDQMKPKPALEQMGVSYSPVLTSIELWTPQVYAGSKIRPVIHVVNDAEDFSDLSDALLKVELEAPGKTAAWSNTYPLPKLDYFAARGFTIDVELPSLATGDYVLRATVQKNGKAISQNWETIYISAPRTVPANASTAPLPIFDPRGATVNALSALGIRTQLLTDLQTIPSAATHLIIAEEAFSASTPLPAVKNFVARGGRVLCLAQNAAKFDAAWLPSKIQMLQGTATDPTYTPKIRPTADQQNINPERPWHPVFNGIGRERLRLWSDYTGWDQSKKGFPKVYPVTHGFKLLDDKDLGKTAILADYDRGLEGIAIAEMFEEKGSVVFTGLDLVNRAGLDPVADQMLVNLVSYLGAAEHEVLPLIEKPITWGDYPTERGVLTGPIHGLIYNCRWMPPPTAPGAKPYPDNTGAWNTHPGNPFLPKGVRPFGPYTWSTGASPREESKDKTGTGVFHCRVPDGRKFVQTKVENTQAEPLTLHVSVNGAPAQATNVAPGKAITVRTPIGGGTSHLSVRYTGDKQLVILETAFQ
ncbi:MAG: glycoside hydrolase family 2 TIM barrel-domain containing protein [Candidatus Sumerlaeaceae bacterium]